MKKLVSIFLCAVLMLSAFGTVAFASDEVITSVFFASDAQFYKSYTQTAYGSAIENCIPVVDTLVKLAKDNGHEIETFVFGGDYTQNEVSVETYDPNWKELFGETRQWHYGNNPKYTLAGIKDAIANYYSVSDANQIYLQGNHEPDISNENDYGLTLGGAYEYDDYIVYVINDQDLAGPRPRCDNETAIAEDDNGQLTITKITDPEAVVTATANALKGYLDGLIAKGDNRPVFIASHQPLYSERVKDYNCHADIIADVVNEAAKKLDIIYFFGHTHQSVDNIGGALSYVGKGETLKITHNNEITGFTDPKTYTLTDSDYKEITLNFTYMNFGHLARYSGTNGNVLSSTVIDITKDKLILTRYRARAEYTDELAKVISTYEIDRINPAETVIDGNGETKTLTSGENYEIPSGTVYKNGTIDATDGTVTMKGLTLSGKIDFDENGKISVAKGEKVKIVNGTNNTFLQKDTITEYTNSYTITVKNNSTNKSTDVTFNFDPIYSGDVMFRLDIENVPEAADLTVLYGK